MALTGDVVDAQRALEIGLVNRVVEPEQLLGAATELAARIAAFPRLALEATKQQLRQSWHLDLVSSMNASFWAVATMSHTEDLKEGIAAAREKRAASIQRREPDEDVTDSADGHTMPRPGTIQTPRESHGIA